MFLFRNAVAIIDQFIDILKFILGFEAWGNKTKEIKSC